MSTPLGRAEAIVDNPEHPAWDKIAERMLADVDETPEPPIRFCLTIEQAIEHAKRDSETYRKSVVLYRWPTDHHPRHPWRTFPASKPVPTDPVAVFMGSYAPTR